MRVNLRKMYLQIFQSIVDKLITIMESILTMLNINLSQLIKNNQNHHQAAQTMAHSIQLKMQSIAVIMIFRLKNLPIIISNNQTIQKQPSKKSNCPPIEVSSMLMVSSSQELKLTKKKIILYIIIQPASKVFL